MSRTQKLANGRDMPTVGLGMYRVRAGEEARRTVLTALEEGYRLIDTAALYGNETSVGQAVKDSGIDRSGIFVTTKLHPFRIAGIDRAFYGSLKRLGLDYVDLYLIHWPFLRRHAIWDALQPILANGDARAIGVSNFRIQDIESLDGSIPMVNQVEFHPFLYRRRLLEYSQAKGMVLEAHSPLIHGKRLSDPRFTEVARRYDKSVAQVLVRWSVQHDLVTIPKATRRDHLQQNISVFDFSLSDSDMSALDALNENYHVAGLSRLVGDPS